MSVKPYRRGGGAAAVLSGDREFVIPRQARGSAQSSGQDISGISRHARWRLECATGGEIWSSLEASVVNEKKSKEKKNTDAVILTVYGEE